MSSELDIHRKWECAIEKVGGVRYGQQGRCPVECAHCRFIRGASRPSGRKPIIEKPSGPVR